MNNASMNTATKILNLADVKTIGSLPYFDTCWTSTSHDTVNVHTSNTCSNFNRIYQTDQELVPSTLPTSSFYWDEDFEGDVDQRKHAAEPIKEEADIEKVISHLKEQKRYRDLLLFVIGINTGLRASDLLRLRLGDVVAMVDGQILFKRRVSIREKKTSKVREAYMSAVTFEALQLYVEDRIASGATLSPNDYLFFNASNSSKGASEPLKRYSLERILKRTVNDECGINVRASTHMLRKTFAYHILRNVPEQEKHDPLLFLMHVTGHSSREAAMAYVGVTREEVRDVCCNLNLGGGALGVSARGTEPAPGQSSGSCSRVVSC